MNNLKSKCRDSWHMLKRVKVWMRNLNL